MSINTLRADNADRESLQTLTPVLASIVVARMDGHLRDSIADRTAPMDSPRTPLLYQRCLGKCDRPKGFPFLEAREHDVIITRSFPFSDTRL